MSILKYNCIYGSYNARTFDNTYGVIVDKKANKPITTIFFDFGNTLHNYNLDLFFQWLSRQYNIPRRYFWNLFGHYPDGLIFSYECGQTTKDFLESFRKAAKTTAEKIKDSMPLPSYTDEDFRFHWNRVFDPFPPSGDKLDLLRNLKNRGYTLAILSNTNEMHYDYITKSPRFQSILNFFESFYIASCKVGCRKNKLRLDGSNRKECEEIFWKAYSLTHCVPEEAILIDDIESFIEVFHKMGGKGIHHRGSWTQIEKELDDLGILLK